MGTFGVGNINVYPTLKISFTASKIKSYFIIFFISPIIDLFFNNQRIVPFLFFMTNRD